MTVWVVVASRIPDETITDSVWSTAELAWARAGELKRGYDDFGDHWSAHVWPYTVDAVGRLVITPYEDQ